MRIRNTGFLHKTYHVLMYRYPARIREILPFLKPFFLFPGSVGQNSKSGCGSSRKWRIRSDLALDVQITVVRTHSAKVEKHLLEEKENMEEARRRLKVLAGECFSFFKP
jgi:hypothetical protein